MLCYDSFLIKILLMGNTINWFYCKPAQKAVSSLSIMMTYRAQRWTLEKFIMLQARFDLLL